MSVSSITTYQFRNLSEVATVMDSIWIPKMTKGGKVETSGIRTLTLSDSHKDHVKENVTSPASKHGVSGSHVPLSPREAGRIRSLNDTHDHINGAKDKLKSLKINTVQSFKGSQYKAALERTLTSFDKREKEVLRAELEVHNELHEIAEKKIPEDIRKNFIATLRPIANGLVGKYKSADKRYSISVTDDGGVQFQQILGFKGLTNDKGLVYPELYLVCSCVVLKAKHNFFVDTDTSNPLAVRAPLHSMARGFPYSNPKDGVRLLRTHLLADDQIDVNTREGLPKPKAEIEDTKFRHPSVTAVDADEVKSTITLTLAKGTDIQESLKTILPDLQGLFYSDTTKERIRYKEGVSKLGSPTLVFHVPAPSPRIGANYKAAGHRLDVLQHDLELSPKQVVQIKRILRSQDPHK